VKVVRPLIINGKPLKSINQFYNKERARLQSCIAAEGRKTAGCYPRYQNLWLKRSATDSYDGVGQLADVGPKAAD